MIKSIQQFFREALQPVEAENNEQKIALAAAALLVEIMQMDHQSTNEEVQTIKILLQEILQLTPAQTDELFALASQEINRSVDIFQFTRLINEHYNRAEKYRLLVALWQVAFADQSLDKYEESRIRKICDLLYLDHVDFIRAKKEASPQ